MQHSSTVRAIMAVRKRNWTTAEGEERRRGLSITATGKATGTLRPLPGRRMPTHDTPRLASVRSGMHVARSRQDSRGGWRPLGRGCEARWA